MNRLITVYDDKESLNNVISELSLNVDEVFYVYHHEVSRTSFDNITKVIRRYKNIDIRFIQLKDDVEELNDLIDENTIVDVGGAKYLSLLLFDLCKQRSNQMIYYDDEENNIKDYRTHKVLDIDVIKLKIEDILQLKGGEIQSQLHHNVTDEENKEIVVKVVEDNLDKYNDFIKYLSLVNGKLSDNNYRGNNTFAISRKDYEELSRENRFDHVEELFELREDRIAFRNRKLKEFVTVAGTFLENYLFIKLNEINYFDDMKMSVIIDFSDDKYSHPVRCEIDCLLVKNNHLLFTSCKSSKTTTGDLNEIYVHNKMFGNCLSKPIICVGEELDRRYPSIYAKAIELGIFIVDKSSFLAKGVAETFIEIIEDAYKYDSII